jgi:excisionase family DNA binding protein
MSKTESAGADNGALTLTVPEAGRRLGLSRNGAYEAAARGDLPTVRIGGRIFVPTRAIEAMLDGAMEAWRGRVK